MTTSTKGKKKKTARATATQRFTKIATRSAKQAKKTAQLVATGGAEKAREAAQFVYKHRKKIMDAVELLTAVLGTASQVLGKPGKSKKSATKSRRRKRA